LPTKQKLRKKGKKHVLKKVSRDEKSGQKNFEKSSFPHYNRLNVIMSKDIIELHEVKRCLMSKDIIELHEVKRCIISSDGKEKKVKQVNQVDQVN